MKLAYSNQWLAFLDLTIVIGLILLIQLWPLRLLYLDKNLRSALLADMEKISTEQGWLLSDIAVHSLTPASATLTYEPHSRVPIQPTCYSMDLATASLQPCAAH